MHKLLDEITDFYIASRDFNGIPYRDLKESRDEASLKSGLSQLIGNGSISVVFGDGHPNPHIKALPDHHSAEKQIDLLGSSSLLEHACLYPMPSVLAGKVDRSRYVGKPYTLELALGAPQLVHRSFDLSVLEFYRNDPRYDYSTDDIHGSISIQSAHLEVTKESDSVFLQTFGFCFDDDLNRFVAVFLRYLADLSPEHQQIWKAKEIGGRTRLHPDYYRTSVIGDWPERASLFEAFLDELRIINKMTVAAFGIPLFRNDFEDKDRPKGFGYLLRPTQKCLDDFVHLLDKMLSDNFNKDFFVGDLLLEERVERGPGEFEIVRKGTVQLLSEWLTKHFRVREGSGFEDVIRPIRKIRKLRQRPAHAIDNDRFDQAIAQEQRILIQDAYKSVRTLRLIFANHPKAKEVLVPDYLFKGEIWSY